MGGGGGGGGGSVSGRYTCVGFFVLVGFVCAQWLGVDFKSRGVLITKRPMHTLTLVAVIILTLECAANYVDGCGEKGLCACAQGGELECVCACVSACVHSLSVNFKRQGVMVTVSQ